MNSEAWQFVPYAITAGFARVMIAGGRGREGFLLALRAIGPGFLLYAIALWLVERAGFPGWLPGIGVLGMIAGFAWAEKGGRAERAVRQELGAAADAVVVPFQGFLSRIEPWTEAEEPVWGTLVRDARGTAVTLTEGSPEGPFAPDRVTETEHGYDLRTAGGLLRLRIAPERAA